MLAGEGGELVAMGNLLYPAGLNIRVKSLLILSPSSPLQKG